MGKEFYTERDIEDMVGRGERSIIIDDDVVLTDLAYEKAKRLGVTLVQSDDAPPAAPMRPYINQPISSQKSHASPIGKSSKIELIRANVKSAVREKLGSQVNDELLDRIIDRVASELGLK
jgi:hypothetical protein